MFWKKRIGIGAGMNQLAWLDFYCGQWHLATSVQGNSVRKWMNREVALSDLTREGWITIESHHKKAPDLEFKHSYRRLTLARTIQ